MIAFLSSEALWLLLAGPVLVGAYVLLMRRRRKVVLRYATLAPLKEAWENITCPTGLGEKPALEASGSG